MLSLPLEISWNQDERHWECPLVGQTGNPILKAKTPQKIHAFLRSLSLLPRDNVLEMVEPTWYRIVAVENIPCGKIKISPDAVDYDHEADVP